MAKDDDRTNYAPEIIPVILFVLSLIIPTLLLPKNCSFFESQPGPFSCDAIPNNCCEFGIMFLIAHVILCLGIGLSLGTFIYFFRHAHTAEAEEIPKLFD